MFPPSSLFRFCRQTILILSGILLTISCSKEEAVPVVNDFGMTIVDNDYSIPVRVAVFNRTVGADAYRWTFEGADRTSSTDRNPGTLVYKAAGTYTIRLDASNADGSEESKELQFTVDAAVEIGFETEVETNNFAPAVFEIKNTTRGATSFQWTFEGGHPATSDQENPGSVVFDEPGEHRITLQVGNGRELHEMEQIITVGSALSADFDWEVDFQDEDLQVPVTLSLENKSEGALTYQWRFSDGTPGSSSEEHPTITLVEPGIHTLELIADNGKETRMLTKSIKVFEDTNLRVFEDVRFGINTAHSSDTIGAFFSATDRKVYTKSELEEIDGASIDIVFFGLGSDFSLNKFVSPDDLNDTTFQPISAGGSTKIINSMELCECPTTLSINDFNTMTDDSPLLTTLIEETEGGRQHFDNETVPRIVLFQTQDGRNGAIKIEAFVVDGADSYIETEIKIQKLPR